MPGSSFTLFATLKMHSVVKGNPPVRTELDVAKREAPPVSICGLNGDTFRNLSQMRVAVDGLDGGIKKLLGRVMTISNEVIEFIFEKEISSK